MVNSTPVSIALDCAQDNKNTSIIIINIMTNRHLPPLHLESGQTAAQRGRTLAPATPRSLWS